MMPRLTITCRRLPAFLLLCTLCLALGCTKVVVNKETLPPILSADELVRPYDKVATIEVSRERYGHPEDANPQDYSWAYTALRQEAARIGADAVINPEVKIEQQTFTFIPTSEIKARGTAIKFR